MAPSESSLRQAWQAEAGNWIAWARRPGHDSFERYHRDLFWPLILGPGRRTLDLGCGEGRLAQCLHAAGHRVLAVDASPTLATAARDADAAIPVVVADAAALPVREDAVDLVVAFMSLQDVDDLLGAVREIARVLEPGGALCVAIVHPLNSAGAFTGGEPDSPFVLEGSYLEAHRYADRVARDGLEMTFHSRHRPLEDYTRALERAGLVIEALREPALPDHALRTTRDRRWQRIPLFLHLRARKDRH